MKQLRTGVIALCLAAVLLSGCVNASAQNTAGSTAARSVASSAVVSTAAANTNYEGGSGTQEDPYQIGSVKSLLAFASNVNDGSQGGYADSYFKLTSDLDLSGVEWAPIGNMGDMKTHSTLFLGSFNGDGHTISNLNYNSNAFNCGAGLFGVSCGEVKNLTLENATVTVTEGTSLAIGGVVGYNMGSVNNVTLKGDSTITGNCCVGGIAGGNNSSNSSITNCTVDGATVVIIGDNHFTDKIVQADVAECGGLVVGGSFGGSIDSCTASGTVKATGSEPVGLGGIGGCLEMMDTITNCTADVTIECENGGHAIGGLCGYAGTHSNPDVCLKTEGFSTKNYPSVIDNCIVTVNIKANDATHVGGLVGTGLYFYGEETAFKITNCSVTGSIEGAVTPGTVAGRAEGSTIENCTVDVTIDGTAGTAQVGTTTRMYESADQ